MDLPKHISLPLLAKELVELSARPRTYQVRVAYASILFFISWMVLYSQIPSGATTPLSVLGCGQNVMLGLGYMQNVGLQLVLSALACGVFTIEKERNTLSLLFLTRLGPWTILFEKYLSRLLVALNFLLLSLPVMGFCYALGGITVDSLLAQLLSLSLTSLYIVSIAVMCSAYFRTTSAALLATYVLIFLTRMGMYVAWAVAIPGVFISSAPWDMVWGTVLGGSNVIPGSVVSPTGGEFLTTACMGIPWVLLSLVCFLLARYFLVRRAFLAPRSPLKEFFRSLDRLFDRANNNSWTRGIVLIRQSDKLPDGDPVAWRETTTRSLGQPRYLIRLLLVLEVPLLLLLLTVVFFGSGTAHTASMLKSCTTLVQAVIWVGMTLVTCVLGAGLISGERGRQTLDVLLVTPLFGRDIVSQKMAGVTRLIWICEVPLITCVIFLTVIEPNILYALCQASMLLIYPRLVAWVAMWHGLRSKTAIAATVKSIMSVLWRCLGPYVVMYAIAFIFFFNGSSNESLVEALMMLTWLSPVSLYVLTEFIREADFADYSDFPFALMPPTLLIATTVIQGLWLLWVRASCLDRADVLLGRRSDIVGGFPADPIARTAKDGWQLRNRS